MRDTAGRTLVHQEALETDPLLLGKGTSNCNEVPHKADGGLSRTSSRATSALADQCDQWTSADAESVTKDLPRVSWPEAISKSGISEA